MQTDKELSQFEWHHQANPKRQKKHRATITLYCMPSVQEIRQDVLWEFHGDMLLRMAVQEEESVRASLFLQAYVHIIVCR